ncbi:hypothetical protein SAMN02746009_03588 [Hymenobacter psychrotolerans DSM 18569]|uniref:Uncharacterized protein n=1 Tax=Hymenobacter psychrotolerans DSM 18569 TaxID=1121959 RepID=A0A1M7EG54_9BACT|nr:hypothetical protein SAMN02746009_03588 [Hymenobacter psychrotolerans DSM 18569]
MALEAQRTSKFCPLMGILQGTTNDFEFLFHIWNGPKFIRQMRSILASYTDMVNLVAIG